MPFAAVIFDFDGLIIDSETPLFEIWQEIYTQHGTSLALEDWQHALGTQGGFDPYADLRTRSGQAVTTDRWAGWISREHWRRCETQPLLPGVADRLAEARKIGVKTAVASSSQASWVRPWLERHDLLDAFDAVCTRDDVIAVKPAPDLFLLAARRLNVPAEACLVFEDSPNGLRAARAAGMWAIAVPNTLTQPLELPPHDLALESLAICTLTSLRDTLRRPSPDSRLRG